MNTRRTLRMIGKSNAPIILVAGLGVCTMLGYAAVSFVRSRLELRRDDVVNVEARIPAQWQLGAFAPVWVRHPAWVPSLLRLPLQSAFLERSIGRP